MTQGLTMDEFLKAVAALPNPRGSGYEVVAHPILKGHQVVILSAGKAYYSPDMSGGEVRVIEIPEFKIEALPMFFDIDYKPRANI